MTTERAKEIAATRWWEHAPPEVIVAAQLWQPKLMCEWPAFHQAVETVVGHEVLTHEFGIGPHLERVRREAARALELESF